MTGKFYVIGVGPGDPELITVKGLRILEESSVLVVPKGKIDGNSTALAILEQIVSIKDKEIIEIYFPMKKIRMDEPPHPEVDEAWHQAASKILDCIAQGKTVAFPTLGDPAIYSTGFYTCQTLYSMNQEVETYIIPGVPSMSSCSATTGIPLCQGDDMLAVVPATFNNQKLAEVFSTFQTIVLMKVHRVMDRLTSLLKEHNLLDKAVLIERNAQNDERIIHDLTSVKPDELHYFSTIIVRTR